MKILVLLGSPRKQDGYKVCKMLEEKVKSKGEVEFEFEYINVSRLHIEECRGCELCLTKGESYCPIKDDLAMLRQKMQEADGIIFNSPVYACHITGSLKKVVDRFGYLFHRPELIGKPALTVTTTAGGGIGPTSKYLKMLAVGFGCQWVGEIKVVASYLFEKRWGGQFFNANYGLKIDGLLEQKAKRFYKALTSEKLPKPSVYDVYVFYGLKSKTIASEADYNYWKEKGWLKASYYYPTSLGPVQQLVKIAMELLLKALTPKKKNEDSSTV